MYALRGGPQEGRDALSHACRRRLAEVECRIEMDATQREVEFVDAIAACSVGVTHFDRLAEHLVGCLPVWRTLVLEDEAEFAEVAGGSPVIIRLDERAGE